MAYNHYEKIGPWVPDVTNFEPEHATHIEEGVEGNEQNVNIINYSLANEWQEGYLYSEFDLVQHNGLFYYCTYDMKEWCERRGLDPIEWVDEHNTIESQAQFWKLTDNGDIGWIISGARQNASQALDENRATQKSLEVTNRSLDALWKLNEGQTYSIETQTEQGTNIPPSGATHILDVAEIYGKSEQAQLSGKNLFNPNVGSAIILESNGATRYGTAFDVAVASYISAQKTNDMYVNVFEYDKSTNKAKNGTQLVLSSPTEHNGYNLTAGKSYCVITNHTYREGAIFTLNEVQVQLEAGNTATDFEPFIVDNLLNPTLQSDTNNGVTVTKNNTDNTYSLRGTATSTAFFYLGSSNALAGVYRVMGYSDSRCRLDIRHNGISDVDAQDGNIAILTGGVEYNYILRVESGFNCDGIVVRPILTTKLSATYNDYVPYRTLPSPSPSFPQPIKSVSELEFKVVRVGEYGRLLTDFQRNWLVDNQDKWYGIESVVEMTKSSGTVNILTPYDSNYRHAYVIKADNSIEDIRWSVSGTQAEWELRYSGVYYLYANNSFGKIDSIEKMGLPSTPQTNTIRLPKPLCSVGEYKDAIKVDEGVIERNIKTMKYIDLVNTYGVNLSSTYKGSAYFIVPNIMPNTPLLARDFRYVTSYPLYKPLCCYADSNSISLYLQDSAWGSKNDAINYMRELDGSVLFALATPTTEPIPSDVADYLQSLEKLSADHTITVVDQEGRDASYVLDYIISLKEVR